MYAPRSSAETAACVADALADGRLLEIVGGGTRCDIGAPRSSDVAVLGTAGLSGIIAYDPAELVLTARAGTPLADLETALAERGQAFLFEPGGAPGSTIGGVIGAAISGSRRVSGGAVRDHLLGFEAVSGRGEVFKAGGKVVKNVTGYDLSKLMCGAWGRLAVLTEVTLKVLPAPPVTRTLVWSGLDAASGWALMGDAMRLPAEVAAAAYLPAGDMALLRIEGFGPSVDARAALLVRAFAAYGAPASLDGAASNAAWRPLVEAAALADEPVLWRVSVPRSAGLAVANAVAHGGGRWIADWAGGLLWCALDGAGEALRAQAVTLGGHATLWRAPPDLRSRVPAFHPQPAGLAALAARVRKAFDPQGLFDTDRFLDRGDAN